jgi:hypothetical protein
MRFINEQNSQELQISHSLRICFFTELRKVTVGAGFLLLLSHTESAQTLRLASEFLTTRRFLPPGCTSWVPGACSCIHTQNQRFYTQNQRNSAISTVGIRIPGGQTLPAAGLHIVGAGRFPAFTHRISSISTVGIRSPGGQTLPAAGLHIVGAWLFFPRWLFARSTLVLPSWVDKFGFASPVLKTAPPEYEKTLFWGWGSFYSADRPLWTKRTPGVGHERTELLGGLFWFAGEEIE